MSRRLGFCIAILVTMCVGPEIAHATVPGDNGKIAFTSTRDGNKEIYVVDADGSGETRLTNHADDDWEPAWSPDGQKIAFISDRDLANYNQYPDLWIMNADGSDQTRLSIMASGVSHVEWFPDGSRILFDADRCSVQQNCGEQSVSPEGGDITPYNVYNVHWGNHLTWSPYGEPLAYIWSYGSVHTVNPDGTGHAELLPDYSYVGSLDWSPDGSRLATWQGTGLKILEWPSGEIRSVPNGATGAMPTWSPDGTRFAFSTAGSPPSRIATMRTDGTDTVVLTDGPDLEPDWQTLNPVPVPPGYARPKAAHVFKTFLVPAYQECLPADADRTHGPPLAHPSCNPPQLTSPYLTVGTADSNGRPTLFLGSVQFRTLRGDPGTPADEADVAIEASMTDVRCRFENVEVYPCNGGPLTDYLGELELATTIRITDKPPTGVRTGTMRDLTLRTRVTCDWTPDDVAGSTCALTTSMDALTPGAVAEARRSVWSLDEIEVLDGGPDGEADTQVGNERFATQGVFVP